MDNGGWVKRKQPLNLLANRVTSLAQMRLTLIVQHLADISQRSDGPYKQSLPVGLFISLPEMNSLPAANSFQEVRQEAIHPEADSRGANTTTTYPELPLPGPATDWASPPHPAPPLTSANPRFP